MTQELKQELKPDICVIGAGAAGRAAASAAAAFGVPVVLIEKGALGGDAGNGGSVPAAALAVTAERANIIRNAAHFGLKTARFGVDFAAVKAHLRDIARTVAPSETPQRLAGLGVRIVDGTARFLDARTVAAGDFTIAARRFVIATGSLPALPAIPGLADTPHLTSDTVFDLADCPRHLIVIGAGSIGLELAQTFRRLGADVTVLEAATPLASDDPECAAIVLDALEREGITLRIGVTIARVRRVLARIEIDITTARRTPRPLPAVIFSSPSGAGRMSKSWISTPPASATSRTASTSTGGCAPPTSASTPSATSPPDRNRPISPPIMRSSWSGTHCSASTSASTITPFRP